MSQTSVRPIFVGPCRFENSVRESSTDVIIYVIMMCPLKKKKQLPSTSLNCSSGLSSCSNSSASSPSGTQHWPGGFARFLLESLACQTRNSAHCWVGTCSDMIHGMHGYEHGAGTWAGIYFQPEKRCPIHSIPFHSMFQKTWLRMGV